MKAFHIGRDQISRVIAGIVGDELGRRFKRYTDFLTLASWTGATPIGEGGLGLKDAERAACAQAIERFFGADADCLDRLAPAVSIADWAGAVEAANLKRLGALTFTPAGRDGDADASTHAASDAFRDAAAAANLLHGRRRLVSLVGPQGYIGFVLTVLAPNLLKIESADRRGEAPDDLAAFLAFGDAVVATPTIWRYLIGEGLRAPDNTIGVVFGEALTPELAAEMRKNGFGAIREIYGSTESGLVAWRDSPGEPFTLFDSWKRDGDNLARLTADGQSRRQATMDAFEWTNERNFRLGARRDGAVQVGAVNVFPDRIAAIIRLHPSVAECVVRVRQANGLNRLVARIRLKNDQLPSERAARDIDAWCRAQLRPQERPRIYNFEADLDGA